MSQEHSRLIQLDYRDSVPLGPQTTLGIGGPARSFVEVRSALDVSAALTWARERSLETLFLGDGSNLLVADAGFDGLAIRNRIDGIERDGVSVKIGSATSLIELIEWLNRNSLAGMETMYGIPGSLAGAIVGNAGAYGQEISDVLVEVEAVSEKGLTTFPARELDLRYRHSLFKERRECFVLSCVLKLSHTVGNLQRVSDSILRKRLAKYPVGLKCPGSFFKNIIADDLTREQRNRIPHEFNYFGKIPAGKLLQAVGANGRRIGQAEIADHHGNLMINRGQATSGDMLSLTRRSAEKVQDRFGILLEPEVRLVGDNF